MPIIERGHTEPDEHGVRVATTTIKCEECDTTLTFHSRDHESIDALYDWPTVSDGDKTYWFCSREHMKEGVAKL